MLSVVTILLDLILLFTGIVASITDFKSGKIYNQLLKVSSICGGTGMLFYLASNRNFIMLYLLNFAAAFVLGFIFFQQKIWAAGDAKLWMVMVLLFPYHQYVRSKYMIFPCMYILMMIFLVAYVYVIAESLFCMVHKKKGIISQNGRIMTKDFLIQWLFSFFVISFISKLLQMVLKNYFYQNQLFFSLLFLVFIQWLSNKRITRKKWYTIILGVLYIGTELQRGHADVRQYIVNGIIVLAVLMIGRMGAKYNYREILTKDVKEGMVLSGMTVALFQASRVKNLPLATDETTKSRISNEEAEAVRRWENSKYGKKTIVIISILPFAVFELLGMCLYGIMTFMIQR